MRAFFVQIKTELKLHFREPEAIFWGFFFPVLMIVVLGFVFSENEDEANKRTVYIEQHSAQNATLFGLLSAQQSFRLVELKKDSLLQSISEGEINLGITSETVDSITFVTLNYASIAENDLQQFLPQLEAVLAKQNYVVLNVVDRLPYSVETQEIAVENKAGNSVNYVTWLIPGVLALNLFLSCIFGIGISVVQDKRLGKLKKIATTPLAKWKFMLAMSLQRMLVLFIQVIVIILAGWLIFDVTILGSVFELIVVIGLSMLSFMMFGFAVAAVSNTIEKAVALANLFFISSLLLSGAYFSNAGLPSFIKYFANILPVTLSVDLIRGIYAYGDSMMAQPETFIGLCVWIVFSLILSVKLFSWYND